MKKNILFILLALSQVVFADYKPMLSPNKVWTYANFNSEPRDADEPFLHNFLEIKTHIMVSYNGLTYWLLDEHALRENIDEKVVYIIPNFAGGARDEYVMYDFNKNIGDTIHNLYRVTGAMSCLAPLEQGEIYAVVKSIENNNGLQVMNVSVESKVLLDDFPCYQKEKWIESVGLDYCPIYDEIKHVSPPFTQHFLLCVNDEANDFLYIALWGEKIGCNAENLNAAIEEVPAEELLNISGNVLTLKDTDVNAVSAIFSADGRQVMSFTGGTADISTLPQGLYVIRTAAANGTNLTAKFVK